MTYQFSCMGTTLGVREVMIQMRDVLRSRELTEDTQSSIEIAVAEGLNNIVKHALTGGNGERIGLELSINAVQIVIRLQDQGRGFSNWHDVRDTYADATARKSDLPEGGFGRGLMCALTSRLEYKRVNGMNSLQMWFDVPPSSEERAHAT